MNNSQVVEILVIALVVCVTLLLTVIGILVCKKLMKSNKKSSELIKTKDKEPKEIKTKEKTYKSYTKESIYNFMEFEKIEDEMIIQKNGNRFLMVVECQGINYDLMSNLEKNAVEEGFLQFLNSLKHPVQIYVQSRTINLNNSLENYTRKVEEYKKKLDKLILEYDETKLNPLATKEVLKKYEYEIVKQRNLYEYGKDIVSHTERMNLNKNMLSKKYYIIVPYYSEDANNPDLDKEEIKNLAFSELYTRAQAIIRTLYACNIKSKILNSIELVNLLYVAYNRDESEIFDIEKAMQYGCEELYSTAPDVYENKIKALNQEIELKAKEKAREAFEIAKTRKQIIAENITKNFDDLIGQMAKKILEDSRTFIGEEMVKKSKEVIEEVEKKKKGEVTNEKRRTRKLTN